MCKVIYKDEYTNATGLIAECETLERAEHICKEARKTWEDTYIEYIEEERYMLDKQIIDLRGHIEPVRVEAGGNRYSFRLAEGDKELEILVSYDGWDIVTERCCELVGEPTNKQLEDKITRQEVEIERLKERLEIQDQIIEELNERR